MSKSIKVSGCQECPFFYRPTGYCPRVDRVVGDGTEGNGQPVDITIPEDCPLEDAK